MSISVFKAAARRVGGKIKRRGIASLRWADWICRDAPRDPLFWLYTCRQSRMNEAAFRQVKARHPEEPCAIARHIDSMSLPKTIWIYWHQGEATAPELIRYCIESWRSLNPGWDVRVLDAATVGDVIDMSDVSEEVGLAHRADLLRFRLLRDFGGIWTDATTLCHRPLDEWLPMHMTGGFFIFRNPGPDRMIESWFIASSPNHPLVTGWSEDSTRFLHRYRGEIRFYFTFFYIFQWRLIRDRKFREAFEQSGGLPALPAFVLMNAWKGIATRRQMKNLLEDGLPLSKLSRHEGLAVSELDRILLADQTDITMAAE